MIEDKIEKLVHKYGEERRELITDVLQWYSAKKLEWKVDMNCMKFIHELMLHIKEK